MSAMADAFRAGRIRALLLSGTDMLSSFADTNGLAEGLERIGLVVCHDLFANDTIRRFADIVLPGTAWLEQLGCKMTNTHLYLMDQALPPAGEAGSLGAVLRGLAARLGLEGFFPWGSEEGFIDAVIDHPSTGHATVAALRAAGGRRALEVSHHAYPDHRFPTPSGKVELYSERAAALGLAALPVFEPPAAEPGHPLRFRQGRTLTHFHAFYDHGQALPSLARRAGRPELWISEDAARARGTAHGAPIRIFNARGSFEAHAHVTLRIGEGSVWMRAGWGGLNRLTSGAPVLPAAALDLFGFSVGQAAFDAAVEVEAR
jgi:anaerobic selenocysteine-containing dehydrogenase